MGRERQRQGEREREYDPMDLGSAFIGIKGGVPRLSRVHCLLVNLKQRELKCRKGKASGQMVNYLSQPDHSKDWELHG